LTHHVIDENVLVVANMRDTHASGDCSLASVEFLLDCSKDETLLLDAEYRILNCYARHCNWSGEPGVGDEFFRWAHDNAARLRRVSVPVTPEGDFTHFPPDPRLITFDPDDRIYVAVVCAAGEGVRLVNAVDSDYSQHLVPLTESGIGVIELCQGELKRE
jgi:hypothetical protein